MLNNRREKRTEAREMGSSSPTTPTTMPLMELKPSNGVGRDRGYIKDHDREREHHNQYYKQGSYQAPAPIVNYERDDRDNRESQRPTVHHAHTLPAPTSRRQSPRPSTSHPNSQSNSRSSSPKLHYNYSTTYTSNPPQSERRHQTLPIPVSAVSGSAPSPATPKHAYPTSTSASDLPLYYPPSSQRTPGFPPPRPSSGSARQSHTPIQPRHSQSTQDDEIVMLSPVSPPASVRSVQDHHTPTLPSHPMHGSPNHQYALPAAPSHHQPPPSHYQPPPPQQTYQPQPKPSLMRRPSSGSGVTLQGSATGVGTERSPIVVSPTESLEGVSVLGKRDRDYDDGGRSRSASGSGNPGNVVLASHLRRPGSGRPGSSSSSQGHPHPPGPASVALPYPYASHPPAPPSSAVNPPHQSHPISQTQPQPIQVSPVPPHGYPQPPPGQQIVYVYTTATGQPPPHQLQAMPVPMSLNGSQPFPASGQIVSSHRQERRGSGSFAVQSQPPPPHPPPPQHSQSSSQHLQRRQTLPSHPPPHPQHPHPAPHHAYTLPAPLPSSHPVPILPAGAQYVKQSGAGSPAMKNKPKPVVVASYPTPGGHAPPPPSSAHPSSHSSSHFPPPLPPHSSHGSHPGPSSAAPPLAHPAPAFQEILNKAYLSLLDVVRKDQERLVERERENAELRKANDSRNMSISSESAEKEAARLLSENTHLKAEVMGLKSDKEEMQEEIEELEAKVRSPPAVNGDGESAARAEAEASQLRKHLQDQMDRMKDELDRWREEAKVWREEKTMLLKTLEEREREREDMIKVLDAFREKERLERVREDQEAQPQTQNNHPSSLLSPTNNAPEDSMSSPAVITASPLPYVPGLPDGEGSDATQVQSQDSEPPQRPLIPPLMGRSSDDTEQRWSQHHATQSSHLGQPQPPQTRPHLTLPVSLTSSSMKPNSTHSPHPQSARSDRSSPSTLPIQLPFGSRPSSRAQDQDGSSVNGRKRSREQSERGEHQSPTNSPALNKRGPLEDTERSSKAIKRNSGDDASSASPGHTRVNSIPNGHAVEPPPGRANPSASPPHSSYGNTNHSPRNGNPVPAPPPPRPANGFASKNPYLNAAASSASPSGKDGVFRHYPASPVQSSYPALLQQQPPRSNSNSFWGSAAARSSGNVSGGSGPKKDEVPKLSLKHFMLLYEEVGKDYICRECKPPKRKTFPTSTAMPEMTEHSLKEHAERCSEILKYTPAKLSEEQVLLSRGAQHPLLLGKSVGSGVAGGGTPGRKATR